LRVQWAFASDLAAAGSVTAVTKSLPIIASDAETCSTALALTPEGYRDR